MNILKTLVLTSVVTFGLSLALAGQAQAANNCAVGPYGESLGPCTKITLDKKVQRPGSKDFVDGLSTLDPKYRTNDIVNFQIVVQNVGPDKISDATVSDFLPNFVTFVSGPGTFDKTNNKLTFKIASLASGESQTFYVVAKVVDNIAFGNNSFMCVVNYAKVTENNGANSDDSAQFCIERELPVYQPQPIKKAPPTGPEAVAIPALFGMGGFGWFLRKKTNA